MIELDRKANAIGTIISFVLLSAAVWLLAMHVIDLTERVTALENNQTK